MHSDMLLKKSALIFQNNFLRSNSCWKIFGKVTFYVRNSNCKFTTTYGYDT